MDELRYIKGLLREMFDIQSALVFTTSAEKSVLNNRLDEITSELKELSGFNQDE